MIEDDNPEKPKTNVVDFPTLHLNKYVSVLPDDFVAGFILVRPEEVHGRLPASSKTITDEFKKIEGHSRCTYYRFQDRRFTTTTAYFEGLARIVQEPDLMIQHALLAQATQISLKNNSHVRGKFNGWTEPFRRLGENSPNISPESPQSLTARSRRELTLDLDNISIPTALGDPITATRYVLEQLGFKGATCVWQLTSSHHPGSTRFHIRLHLLTDQFYSPDELKAWASEQPMELNIDLSQFNPYQIIYTAPPRVISHDRWKGRGQHVKAPDPISPRSGILWGDQDTVSIKIPSIDRIFVRDQEREQQGYKVSRPIQYHAEGKEAEAFTDADLHLSFRDFAYWTLTYHPNITEPDLNARAVHAVEKHLSSRKAEALQRVLQGEVINWARWHGKAKGERNSKLRYVESRFQVNEIPFIEAEQLLTSIMREAINFEGDQQVLVGAPAGLGKTELAIRFAVMPQLDVMLDLEPRVVDFYVSTIDLGVEIVARLEVAGVNARVIRGRLNETADGDPMCKRSVLVKAMQTQGLHNVGSTLCISPPRKGQQVSRCPYYTGCPYINQYQMVQPTEVLVRPHEYLSLPESYVESKSLAERKVTHIFIDENPLSSMIELKEYTEPDLRTHSPLMGEVVGALMANKNLVEVFSDRVDEIRALVQAETRTVVKTDPSMFDETLLSLIDLIEPSKLPVNALQGLVNACRRGEKQFNGLWLTTDVDEESKQTVIRSAMLKPPVRTRGKKVVVMDATLDDILFESVFPGAKTHHIETKRDAIVHQTYNRSYSHSTINKDTGNEARLLRSFMNVLAAPGKTVSAITIKSIDQLLEADDLDIAHLGAIRGLDRMKGVDRLIVQGRIMLPAFGIDQLARALFPYEDIGESSDEAVLQPSGYRMADGSLKGVDVPIFVNPYKQAVMEWKREHEVTQAIDRSRPFRRTNPVEVWLLSSYPLNVEIHSADRDFLHTPNLMALLERFNSILPLSTPVLTSLAPDVFLSAKAAEHWSARTLQSLVPGEIPRMGMIRGAIGNDHYQAMRVDVEVTAPFELWRYKKRGARMPWSMLITCGQDDARVVELLSGLLP